jgi:adenosylcobinamide kinase / adenosylcobinamide-phosphate guanylyltransferase
LLTLVIGGARSGKSRFAQTLCTGAPRVVFVATASQDDDDEMAERIRRHQAERPAHWTTIEAPIDLVSAVRDAAPTDAVLVDCVTLWISNLMFRDRQLERPSREERILAEVKALAGLLGERQAVAVTNEVGEGIVPDSSVAREFRDVQGRANQILAEAAARVVLMVAGLPIEVKPVKPAGC